VPQGCVLGPTLYISFTSDLPTSSNTTLGAFADDIAILYEWGEEERVEVIGRKARGKETTRKTKT
jgi:hypothetical protein